jgi:two-component system chemotaxis response regulator CheB
MSSDGSGHDIIVIGGSAGGVEALKTIVAGLSPDLPAAVFAVIHVSAHSPKLLDAILNREGGIPCSYATDGESIRMGHMYLAQPARHLLLEDSRMRVVLGPKENRAIPAIDPLFRSAAVAFGPRVVGVILGGYLNDGAAGLMAIKDRSGKAVVQRPDDTPYPNMPISALRHVAADKLVRLDEISPVLVQFARDPIHGEVPPVTEMLNSEIKMATQIGLDPEQLGKIARRSMHDCPACGSVLFELMDERMLRFRCLTGHAYTAEALGVEQAERADHSLWAVLNLLEQGIFLRRRLAEKVSVDAENRLSRLEEEIREAQRSVEMVRSLIRQVDAIKSMGEDS